MSSSRPHSSYTEAEVRALVEGYVELSGRRDTNSRGLRILLTLADITRAVRLLPLAHRDVVLRHGVLGLSNEATGRLLGVSEAAIRKRYRQGLDHLVTTLNGGYD